ncbi:CBS domain-containing protein [soil metagenome]
MHASQIQHPFPVVGRGTSAVEGARLIAVDGQPALVIADEKGEPVAVVSAIDVLGLLVPAYVRDDLALAGVMDEKAAEDVWDRASGRTIGELLDDARVHIYDLLTVDADATILEIAAQMADARAQVAMVAHDPGAAPQFVTLPVVMDAILAFCAPGSTKA